MTGDWDEEPELGILLNEANIEVLVGTLPMKKHDERSIQRS